MFILKITGKIIALPLIVLLGAGVTICLTLDKISDFVLGLFNMLAGIIVLYSLFVSHDYSLVRDGIIIVVAENVFFLILGVISGFLDGCKKILMQFVMS